MPHLKELFAANKDKGLVILGIHTKNGAETVADFVKEQAIPWPIATDADGKTVQAFAVDSYPDYYLVDRAGNLRVADLQNGAVDEAVAALLAEPAPAVAPAAEELDAQKRLDQALASAKASGRSVLVHVHGPG
ncbi:MAG: TlpA family protein disulfide reductase [Planctomycetes bacterium]|nr:TlpA family protein disulfide reductase [Planctomycetota bacterium]